LTVASTLEIEGVLGYGHEIDTVTVTEDKDATEMALLFKGVDTVHGVETAVE